MPASVQVFSAEYFSGADVSIYLGDAWLEQITSIDFTLIEQARPLFGYQSYTADVIAHGTRSVVGSFRIPFTRPGYLFDLIKRADVSLSVTLAADGSPSAALQLPAMMTSAAPPPFSPMRVGDQGPEVRRLQSALLQAGIVVPPISFAWPTSAQVLRNGMTHPDVEVLHRRLRTLYVPSSDALRGPTFTDATEHAVRWVQQISGLSVTGEVDPPTVTVLRAGLSTTGTFDLATRAGIIELQVAFGLAVTGELDPPTQTLLLSARPPLRREDKEALIRRYWGEELKDRLREARTRPFFPGDLTIYFSYGSLEVRGDLPRIRALTGVHLTTVSQVVDNSGRAVEDQYNFVATDIDDGTKA